jgi:hypothetical protein
MKKNKNAKNDAAKIELLKCRIINKTEHLVALFARNNET